MDCRGRGVPGKASYSALKLIWRPPDPLNASKDVSRPYACRETVKPCFSRNVQIVSWAWCSSYASSGFDQIYRLLRRRAPVSDLLKLNPSSGDQSKSFIHTSWFTFRSDSRSSSRATLTAARTSSMPTLVTVMLILKGQKRENKDTTRVSGPSAEICPYLMATGRGSRCVTSEVSYLIHLIAGG